MFVSSRNLKEHGVHSVSLLRGDTCSFNSKVESPMPISKAVQLDHPKIKVGVCAGYTRCGGKKACKVVFRGRAQSTRPKRHKMSGAGGP